MEGTNSSFVFEIVTKKEIEKLVTYLNLKKSIQSNDIPAKLVKESGYLFFKSITTSISRWIAEGIFVNTFKKAEVRSIYKKRRKNRKVELQKHSLKCFQNV